MNYFAMKQFKFFNFLQFPERSPLFKSCCYSWNNYTLSLAQMIHQGLSKIQYYQSPKFLYINFLLWYQTVCITFLSSSLRRNIFPWWLAPSLALAVCSLQRWTLPRNYVGWRESVRHCVLPFRGFQDSCGVAPYGLAGSNEIRQ